MTSPLEVELSSLGGFLAKRVRVREVYKVPLGVPKTPS